MDNEKIDIAQIELEGILLMNYIRGNASGAETVRVALWLKESPENEKILLQLARIYYAQRTKERIQRRNPIVAYTKMLHQRQRKSRRVVMQRLSVAAACVAVVIASVVGSYYSIQGKTETQYITIRTNAGMRTNLNLPDGTVVFLNSDSKLTYPVPFDSKERRVLLDGEGYFKVAHKAKHPFIVDVAERQIEVEVLGTEFNMQAYASEQLFGTTLVDGSVKINLQTESGARQHVFLKPSEKAIYDTKAGSLHITHTNTLYDTAWMEGRLMFKDMPVPEVLSRLSHFYNVTFDVEDAIINNYTFTGTFENRRLSQVLDYVCISSQIKYKIVPATEDDSSGIKRSKVILTKKK
jgi:ferric-dicitrate binding protein FerR (iron transport regulator)